MDIVVEAATEDDRAVLRRLVELYRYDFSEFDGRDLDEAGEYGYPWLAQYWTDADRRPFLVRVDGHLAGFALVRLIHPHEIAEFWIARKYRGHGVGRAAAAAVLGRFPGGWRITQTATNPGATAFWRAAIPVPFTERTLGDGTVEQTCTMPADAAP